ncbi:hypothetical protein [Pseudomonas sp.]|uniref:hypothetical protein n=1 Tax=Pseudomonas sp. TaxID=306 RepID=UPI0032668635
MNLIELTIIANTRAALANVKNVYQHGMGTGREEYLKNIYAFHALTKLGADDAGMSADGAKALHELEQEHAAAFVTALAQNPAAMAAIQDATA